MNYKKTFLGAWQITVFCTSKLISLLVSPNDSMISILIILDISSLLSKKFTFERIKTNESRGFGMILRFRD